MVTAARGHKRAIGGGGRYLKEIAAADAPDRAILCTSRGPASDVLAIVVDADDQGRVIRKSIEHAHVIEAWIRNQQVFRKRLSRVQYTPALWQT